jgi:2-succinyl-6-hydroxy-2,4-cyclohexadiene-1-carboxylate synthase
MVRAVSHVVALHGFAGTGRMWDVVDPAYIAPDLPGHGSARDLPATWVACVEQVLRVAPPRFTLAGYSMGGRLALYVALAVPEQVQRLVLIAATAGIDDPEERERRRAADDMLAAGIEEEGIEAFADLWIEQPLFADDPPEAKRLQREDILRNEPAGLAAALRGLGAGTMEPLWHQLDKLPMPVTVLAGERDDKYRALAGRIASGLRGQVDEVVVAGAGHGLPREAPRAVADAISRAA